MHMAQTGGRKKARFRQRMQTSAGLQTAPTLPDDDDDVVLKINTLEEEPKNQEDDEFVDKL